MPVLPDKQMHVFVVLVALVALATGYGTFNIPYIAMPAEMDVSSRERTRLISFRIAAVAIGGIAAVFCGPIIIALVTA
jgi:Na+/melibiose symporter-like transporter